MRTEYTIVVTDKKGKKDYSSYLKKSLAIEKFNVYKPFYENIDCTVELYKVVYYGASLHHADKMEEVK